MTVVLVGTGTRFNLAKRKLMSDINFTVLEDLQQLLHRKLFSDQLNKTNLCLPNLSVKLSSSLPVINCVSLSLLIASMMFQYFVKVVPTVYMKVDGEVSTFFLPLLLWQVEAFRLSPCILMLTISDLWWKQHSLFNFLHITNPVRITISMVYGCL